eukprot:g180.t1
MDLNAIKGGVKLRRTEVQESTGAAQKEDLAKYEAIYNDNGGDIDRIAAALGGSGAPARWKDGVTNEYIGDATRFARLLVEGQLLWSERAPAIGGYAPGSPDAGGKSSGAGGKSSRK